ncbi:MAG TPA: hypothetical protein VE619_01150 [Nitrososphaeraceae archaeon]|nr:hypothetical protein [Nitrososphaeraceae archaeon]
MGLLTWIFLTFILAITILSMIGTGWNLFISSVFRGIDKVLNGISPVARDLGNEARQYAANINKSP